MCMSKLTLHETQMDSVNQEIHAFRMRPNGLNICLENKWDIAETEM